MFMPYTPKSLYRWKWGWYDKVSTILLKQRLVTHRLDKTVWGNDAVCLRWFGLNDDYIYGFNYTEWGIMRMSEIAFSIWLKLKN